LRKQRQRVLRVPIRVEASHVFRRTTQKEEEEEKKHLASMSCQFSVLEIIVREIPEVAKK
jgi:hypothetical protein